MSRAVRSSARVAAITALPLLCIGCLPSLPRVKDVGARRSHSSSSAGASLGSSAEATARRGVTDEAAAHAALDDDHDHDDALPALPGYPAPGDPGELGQPSAPDGLVFPGGSATGKGAAMRYAALDRGSCEAELGRRQIAFDRVGETRGVVAPVRPRGAIGGVDFHSMLPAARRKTSPYEIYDCRLVLALHDFGTMLSTRYDVVEAVHYSVYRPPTARALPSGPGRRHSGALAIDLARFKTRDGKTIDVEKDFHGRIGGKTCLTPQGTAAPSVLPSEAATLRRMVCDAADAQLFNVMLTPHYNWAHRNHFHFEVTAGVKWILVR